MNRGNRANKILGINRIFSIISSCNVILHHKKEIMAMIPIELMRDIQFLKVVCNTERFSGFEIPFSEAEVTPELLRNLIILLYLSSSKLLIFMVFP